MADCRVHLSQAKHNEEVANKLIKEPRCHDWGITAAFYAAIHYLESWLFNRPQKHTETSIPVDSGRNLLMTPHAWREKIIVENLSKAAFMGYRNLKNASETARYLSHYRTNDKWIDKAAPDFFTPTDAEKLVTEDLSVFKRELNL